jgi:thiol:disulfide interchange protein DsbD
MTTLLLAVAQIADTMRHQPLVAIPLLFAAGLVTSTNPCIWPMIPITIGTITGMAPESRRRTIALTLTYVAGLALFYAILGLIAGLTGSLFGTISANRWSRLVIANLLLLFALVLLDVIPVRLPARLATWAGSLGGGSYPAVFLLGATSGIVAAPCGHPRLRSSSPGWHPHRTRFSDSCIYSCFRWG